MSIVPIKVLSYNAFMRPVPHFKDGQSDRAQQIPNAVFGLVPDLDVIAFTGVYDESARDILCDMFEKHSFLHSTPVVGGLIHEVKSRKNIFSNGGIFIISKYPIEITKTCSISGISSRGITYAAIRKDKYRFHLFASHISSSDKESCEKETLVLNDFIKGMHISKYEPIIIAGHMNNDYIQDSEYLENVASAIQATTAPISDTSFRATYSSDNTMVGKDGYKPPFHDRWLDFGMYCHEYKDPILFNMTCIRPKPEEPIIISKGYCMSFRNRVYRDLSCHYPILITAEFKM